MASLVEIVAPQEMWALLHRRVELDLEAERIGELQRAALERLIDEGVGNAVLGAEGGGLVEVAVIADLEAEPVAGGLRRLAQHHRVMLVLFAGAQIHRLVVAVLDVEADGVLVEGGALVQVRDVEHGVAAADDVERRIEDVGRSGHRCFLRLLSVIPGRSVRTEHGSPRAPNDGFRFPVSGSCASRGRARRAWFPCRSRMSSRRRRGRCRTPSCRRTGSADGGRFPS